MIEIYLGLFDKDEEVPKASKACKNWSLTDADDGYQLVVDLLNENTEPQTILGKTVTTCEEFYQLIAEHELVIPRITTVLIDHFFPNYDSQTRAALVKSISDSNPTQFEHIFIAILFSKEYLLNNERPKRFEETFFNLADRIYWESDKYFFNKLTSSDESTVFPTLLLMKQPAMRLKLGRWKDQPLDSLSFATYHQGIREKLLIKQVGEVDESLTENQIARQEYFGWSDKLIRDSEVFTGKDFIQFHFLSVLGRYATDVELLTLEDFITKKAITDNPEKKSLLIMDYLSRLPELYYFNKIDNVDLSSVASDTTATNN
jgi:hypothetical protein